MSKFDYLENSEHVWFLFNAARAASETLGADGLYTGEGALITRHAVAIGLPRAVLKLACTHVTEWLETGIDIPLSIPLKTYQVTRGDVVKDKDLSTTALLLQWWAPEAGASSSEYDLLLETALGTRSLCDTEADHNWEFKAAEGFGFGRTAKAIAQALLSAAECDIEQSQQLRVDALSLRWGAILLEFSTPYGKWTWYPVELAAHSVTVPPTPALWGYRTPGTPVDTFKQRLPSNLHEYLLPPRHRPAHASTSRSIVDVRQRWLAQRMPIRAQLNGACPMYANAFPVWLENEKEVAWLPFELGMRLKYAMGHAASANVPNSTQRYHLGFDVGPEMLTPTGACVVPSIQGLITTATVYVSADREVHFELCNMDRKTLICLPILVEGPSAPPESITP